jgi:hypothetical protein
MYTPGEEGIRKDGELGETRVRGREGGHTATDSRVIGDEWETSVERK